MTTLEITTLFSGSTTTLEIQDTGAEQFYFRLRKVAKERLKRARRSGISAVRIYDADLPDFSLYIELFETWECAKDAQSALQHDHRPFVREAKPGHLPTLTALVCEYAPPAHIPEQKSQARFSDACAIVAALFELDEEHLVTRARTRAKGGSQYARADREQKRTYTLESNMVIELDFGSYLDTGLFLDHRLTRAAVGCAVRASQNKRMLNLFAYTGVATLHALSAEALQTTTVDLSQTYLEWTYRNAHANGFTVSEPEKYYAATQAAPAHRATPKPLATTPNQKSQAPYDHKLIRADVVTWLSDQSQIARQVSSQQLALSAATSNEVHTAHQSYAETHHQSPEPENIYDVIFCDPPTFSNSKSMGDLTWDVQRDHVHILRDMYELLAEDGLIIFSCNLRGFVIDESALYDIGYSVLDITAQTIPFDFERNQKIHQCFVLCKLKHSRSMREVLQVLNLR